MNTKKYKRGTYDKTTKKDRRVHMIISQPEFLKIQILSEQLQKNYTDIIREGIMLLWDKHKNEFMCESLFIDYLKTI